MNDIELQALSMLVYAEAVDRAGTNLDCEARGCSAAYTDLTSWPNKRRLEAELERRGIAE